MAKHHKRLRESPTRQTHYLHCPLAEVDHGYPLRSWALAALFHEAAALLPALGLSVRDSAVLGRRLGAQVAHRRRRADASRGCPHWRRLKVFNGFEGGRYGTNV